MSANLIISEDNGDNLDKIIADMKVQTLHDFRILQVQNM